MRDRLQQPRMTLRLANRLTVGSVALLATLWLLSRFDFAVQFYADSLFPKIVFGLTRISNLIPFSLGEVLLWLLVAVVLCSLTRVLGAATRGWGPLWSEIRNFFSWLAMAAGLILVSGYLFWGLNYAQDDLIQRLHWADSTPQDPEPDLVEELEAYCGQAVEFTNHNYLEAFGKPDIGAPSTPSSPPAVLEESIEDGLDSANRSFSLGLQPPMLGGHSKEIFSSNLLSWLGIAGFYFPWTGEANVNRLVPFSSRVHAVAHEKAHQRGITSEDEANLIGFLAAVCSPDPYARYSGYLFAQVQLLEQLYGEKPEAALTLINSRLPGVQRDRDAVREFWQGFEGPAMQVSSSVNDSYLRLHGVEGGIESYSRSARLLILFARRNEGLSPLAH